MKSPTWFSLITLIGWVGLIAAPVRADTIATPIATPVQLSGQAGGTVASGCGNLPTAPQHVLSVTEPFTSLRLRVQGTAASTLLVRQPDGSELCLMADPHSGATLELPGLWDVGSYQIFVGDQSSGRPPFQLEILPD